MTDPSEDRTTPAQPLQNNGLPTEEMAADSGNQSPSGSWYGQPTQPTRPEGDVAGQQPGQQAGQQFGQQPGQQAGQQFGQQFGPMPDQTPGQMPGQVPGQTPGQAPGQMPGQAPGPWGQAPGPWGQAPAAPGPTAPLDPWGEQSTQAAMPPATPLMDPPPFGSAQPPFGSAQPPFGAAQPTFGPAQSPYEAAQPPYGAAQSPYDAGQPTFGPAQSPYDAGQPPYGAAQYPYGAAQPPYDGTQPPSDGFGYQNQYQYQYQNPGPMPQPKSNSGRNAAIAVGSLAVVTALVVALIVTNHHSSNNNAGPVAHTSSVASLTPTATTSATATDTTTSEDTQSTSTALAFDPNQLNSASTDPTPFTTAALLPQSFSDSKSVPYSLAAGGQESCISSAMSSDVQSTLRKYGCTTKMTGSYTVNTTTVNSNDDILVSVQIFAFNDAATAKAVYAAFPANGSWDFGIWCPKTGYGANPCSTNADYQDAYKSDWIGQDYRYVVEATALYTNMSTDSSNKAWTSAAADEAISATGPEYYISTQS